MRLLDRYVAREFTRIFAITAIGFPVFTILINITDRIGQHLARNIPIPRIFYAHLFAMAEQVFFIIPAAVLFATVFTAGALSRHHELTAAKASGISFQRLAAPMFVLAALAAGLAWVVGDIVPAANHRRDVLLGTAELRSQTSRFNFVYRADGGRTYAIGQLIAPQRLMQDVQIEREGTGLEFPGYFLTAARATWDSSDGWWLHDGALRLFHSDSQETAVTFEKLYQRALTEKPFDLLTQPKAPSQMNYRELGHYVQTLERSGGDANKLKVERALKIAVPVTCLVIALFGAPMGVGRPRTGAAYGVAVSLATTIVFLMAVQISKAVGGSGLLPPMLAAWIPNAAFGTAGLVLFVRART